MGLRDIIAKLFKRDHAPKSFSGALAASTFDDQWWRVQSALRESIYSILESDTTNKAELVQQSLMDFMTHMGQMTTHLDDTHKAQFEKMEAPLTRMAALVEEIAKGGETMSDDHVQRLKTAVAEVEETFGKADAEPDSHDAINKLDDSKKRSEEGMKLADVLKAVGIDLDKQVEGQPSGDGTNTAVNKSDEEIKKQFADLQKQADEAKAQVAELKKAAEDADVRAKAAEAVAKAEQEKRVQREYLEKAAQYPHMGAAEDVAKRLRKAYDLDEEFGKQLEADFTKANAAIESGKLFDEAGRVGVVKEGSADAKLEALAKSLVAKDANMTYEQAFDKAMQTPEGARLYEESLREKGVN